MKPFPLWILALFVAMNCLKDYALAAILKLLADVTKKTERKSFFRRLHERKPGAVRIDWEEVVFVEKV